MKSIGLFILFLALAGCAATPRVRYSKLQFTDQPETISEVPDEAQRLNALIEEVRAAQFGDPLFKKNTVVYWIIPEIDRLDLAVTGRAARFSADEFRQRQQELSDQHTRHFIFVVDLRMPFNSGWSKEKLIEFLENNLIVTLENGTNTIFHPERLLFHSAERFQAGGSTQGKELEVQIPVRILFGKTNVLNVDDTKEICVKLRLRRTPPFRIGFFDDKFFQGFRWKIIRDGGK